MNIAQNLDDSTLRVKPKSSFDYLGNFTNQPSNFLIFETQEDHETTKRNIGSISVDYSEDCDVANITPKVSPRNSVFIQNRDNFNKSISNLIPNKLLELYNDSDDNDTNSENIFDSSQSISMQSIRSNKNEEIHNLSTKEKTDEITRTYKGSQIILSMKIKDPKKIHTLPPIPITTYR